MLNDFKKTFGRISVKQTAEDELYQAEKSLLTAQTKLEFAKATVDAETARVARLKQFLANSQGVGNVAQ